MAIFIEAYKLLGHDEGGYNFDPSDPGGETYKGISRAANSKWAGWVIIDMLKKQSNFPANLEQNQELQGMLLGFYEMNYWDPFSGDKIESQLIANSIFDFGVNTGVGTSASLAQMVVGVKPDGAIGPMSLEAINSFDVDKFLAEFTVAKVARYIHIVKKRPVSRKYFYGWICRALNEN
jgi:lysozyme family protein